MVDTVCTIEHSLVQHGKHSDRVYLMKLDGRDVPGIVEWIERLAAENAYTKIFGKVPAAERAPFEERGYVEEAFIPRFCNGRDDVVFLSKFLSPERAQPRDADAVQKNLALAQAKASDHDPDGHDDGRDCSTSPGDVEEMSDVYEAVFPSYPFPIHDPGYLLETMRSHIQYFCVREQGRIVALASAEMDRQGRNVEMTDFATLPTYRGHGFAVLLLDRMEREMRRCGMLTAYTIARAVSPGMNITFAKMGYTFGGTLTNNTNIAGQIESMNVWHKPLMD